MICSQLRDRERSRSQVLQGMCGSPCGRLPHVRGREPRRRQVLRRVCDRAERRSGAGRLGGPWRRSCRRRWAARRRAPARLGPVRRPRRVRPRSPRDATPRTRGSSCRATSTSPVTSSVAMAGLSRSSSATRSWPCGARRRPGRTTPSGPFGPPSISSIRSAHSVRRIQARAGVLTGEAAVTIGATNQGMVAGDLVNTASRLQSAAQPGTVLVGEATHRATSRVIAFEVAGEQTLKGKTAPSRPGAPCA